MLPKPAGLAPQYGAVFKDKSVALAYLNRPPYPAETFEVLRALIKDKPATVLDVGCGTGDIARPLAALVERVDAVDFSAAMIGQGQRLPGGDRANLHWIQSPVETAPLPPPYALITAGESLHWMDWEIVMPRFAGLLTPSGVLAIIDRRRDLHPVLADAMTPLIVRYSTNREWRTYDLVVELEQRGLFVKQGEQRVTPQPWRPTIEAYIERCHSQNGFSRERMPDQGAAFDADVREAIERLIQDGRLPMHDGRLELSVDATITWGRPMHRRA